ncbi:hypothetical protein [Rhodococcus sp. NPDC127528]|uniref:hypothetical protein n=1 Tax=unclassified Rhodococcus (in: high G+C Gram-positive bacteria) TaxID=192944 RepID=UPI0036424259
MANFPSDLIDRSTTISTAQAHLLAPRDAGERVARARLVLAMLAVVAVLTLTVIVIAMMP